jgi:hypothetical protein
MLKKYVLELMKALLLSIKRQIPVPTTGRIMTEILRFKAIKDGSNFLMME